MQEDSATGGAAGAPDTSNSAASAGKASADIGGKAADASTAQASAVYGAQSNTGSIKTEIHHHNYFSDSVTAETRGKVFGQSENAAFDFGREGSRATASLYNDLQRISSPPAAREPVPAELDRYVDVLTQVRVLAILHVPESRKEALFALRAVVARIGKRDQERAVFTSALEEALHLKRFCQGDQWSSELHHSLIYLNRNEDRTALAYVDGQSRDVLIERLKEVNAYLVFTAGVDAKRASEYADGGSWYFPAPKVTTPIEPKFKGRFEDVVALCVCLFPRLSVSELMDLVDTLAPPKPKSDPTAQKKAVAEGNSDSLPASPPPPTREERWQDGERDAVLEELGITFIPQADEDSATGLQEAGFVFADEQLRARMPGWMLSHRTLLITQHFETLTWKYLTRGASSQYCRAYENLLLRHDAFGMQLSSGWFMRQFGAVQKGTADFYGTYQLSVLLTKVLDRPKGESLVGEVINALVNGLLEQERALLDSIAHEKFEAAVAAYVEAAASDADDKDSPNEAFWSTLGNFSDAGAATQSSSMRLMLLSLHVLLMLSQYLPGPVIAAINRILADDGIAGASWTRYIGNEERSSQIARLSRLALQWLLAKVIEIEPTAWAAFAHSIVEHGPPIEEKPTARPRSDNHEIAVARCLAEDCLQALEGALETNRSLPMSDALYAALTQGPDRERIGKLLARLLRRAQAMSSGFSVWIFQRCATAMLMRKNASRKIVSETVFSLAASLRASMSLTERSAALHLARSVQQRNLEDRNQAATGRDLERSKIVAERIEVMNMVIGAFSGAAAAKAAG